MCNSLCQEKGFVLLSYGRFQRHRVDWQQPAFPPFLEVPGCEHNENSSGEKLVDIRVFHKTDLTLFCKDRTLWDSNALSTVLFCTNLNQKVEL